MPEPDQRVAKAIQLHNQLGEYATMILPVAIELGGILIELKNECGHGKWLPFVRANFPFKQRSAQGYMRLYANRAKYAEPAHLADLPIDEALSQSEKYMSMEAKSRRNRGRLHYISQNATQPVLEALNAGKVSISTAEQIAHAAPEAQPQMLARLGPRTRKPPLDTKTITFPGTEDELIHREIVSNMTSTSNLELKAGRYFSPFQKAFNRVWRKLIKEYIKQEPDYMVLWEQASEMIARISTEYPEIKQEDVKRFCQEHGIEYPKRCEF